jgi:hypothetical protein
MGGSQTLGRYCSLLIRAGSAMAITKKVNWVATMLGPEGRLKAAERLSGERAIAGLPWQRSLRLRQRTRSQWRRTMSRSWEICKIVHPYSCLRRYSRW